MARLVPMSSVDAAWLGMEDPTNLMMVTGVMALEGKVDLKRLRTLLDRRLLPFERFHQKVVRPRSRGNMPHWTEDADFDIDHHVSRITLDTPGDDKTLSDLVSELMSTALDFSGPLWHMHVIDGYQGGSVVLARIHHCIADGIALVRVVLSLTDETARARQPKEPAAHRAKGFRLPLDWLPGAVGRGLVTGQDLIAHPGKVRDLAQVGVHGAYRLGRLVVLPPDPDTILKGELGRRKRAAWSRSIPLDDFKTIGKALGATVNDVLIATATGALRRYFESRGEPTGGIAIRASVPVNLRPERQGKSGSPHPLLRGDFPGERGSNQLGNAFGLVFLSLPIGIVDPVRRLRAIKQEMDALKGSPEALVAFGVLSVLGLAPVQVEQLGLRFFSSKATAVLTNVPGPRQPRYLAGRKIDKIMFWVPQSGRLALGVSILSYAGGVMLGVATDEGLVPDPERIVEGFALEFESMRKAARPTRRPAKSTTPTRR
ncbi:MAG: wax ester/triacylglycerol synthase family O-acyltransferase [Candidatus Dormibacter sp.]